MTKKINYPKGFTLVELMVVIAVIGVLAAISTPAIGKMIDRSRSRAFARGVANQYRLARNQAQSTNQAFVVRIWPRAVDVNNRGRVEVWAINDAPANCRSVDFPNAPTPPDASKYEMISVFDGHTIGGNMHIEKKSFGASFPTAVCVQPNGEFLTKGTGTKVKIAGAAIDRLCLGEALVIPLWTDTNSYPDDLYDCADKVSPDQIEARDSHDYWRVSLWDNGQVTVSRK